jgi:hypothetical protein
MELGVHGGQARTRSGLASSHSRPTVQYHESAGSADRPARAVLMGRAEGADLYRRANHAAAFVDGYQIGLYVSAAVMAAGALLALVTLRPYRAAPTTLSLVPEST